MSIIPTPTLSTRSHYSYELDPPVHIGQEPDEPQRPSAPVRTRPYVGLVCRVGVFIHEHQGKPRPTVVVATTTTSRSVFCGVPLDGFPAGPNDDPRLLDVFADLIADAEQRHAQAAARAAHSAYGYDQPVGGKTYDEHRRAPHDDKAPHACQHGNMFHPCICSADADHGRRLCLGVHANA